MASTGGGPNVESDRLRRQLQSMDNYDFEYFVADLWERQGWSTEVEQQSSDAGVDIRATKSSPYRRKALIQAKRYSDGNTVGGRDIQQYSALKQQEPDTDEAIIVTTSRFTNPAEERARELNVKLIDGDGLIRLIDDLNAEDLVFKYVDYPEPESDQSEIDFSFDPEEREQLERFSGKSFDEFVEAEQRRTSQAIQRSQDTVRLHPNDAKELGIFDGIPEEGLQGLSNEKKGLVFLKDDIHMDVDGNLYVADLTEYVDAERIDTDASHGVIGIIEPDVGEGAWANNQRTRSTVRSSTGVDYSQTIPFYAVVAGTAGWSLTAVLMALGVEGPAAGMILLISWVGLPVGLKADSKKTHIKYIANSEVRAYFIISLIPVIALISGVLYLYRRQSRAY